MNTEELRVYTEQVKELETRLYTNKKMHKEHMKILDDTTWTRDSYQTYGNHVINLHSTSGPLSANKAENPEAIRPSFVIDLSKVDYTVTGTVNYK